MTLTDKGAECCHREFESSPIVLMLLFGLVLFLVWPDIGRGDVPVWTSWEQELISTVDHDNSYSRVTVSVTWTGPRGERIAGWGFWDGGRVFRIRTRFPSEGIWHWKTSCSDRFDAGLHDRQGAISVGSYEGNNPLFSHGALQVSENRRYLCHADGTPFLWIGDTAWSALVQCTDQEWADYLKDRVSKRFTVVQIHAGRGFTRRDRDRDGRLPFLGEGNSWRGNPDYWRGVDRKVRMANAHGLYVLLCGVIAPPIDAGKTSAGEQEDILCFARNLAARLAGEHVGFSPVADDLWSQRAHHCGLTLKEASPGQLVLGHPRFFLEPAIRFHEESYTDAGGLQTGAGWLFDPYLKESPAPFSAEHAARAAIEWPLILYRHPVRKPVLNLEGPYDSQRLLSADPHYYALPYPTRLPRSVGYWGFLSGAMGYTYGAGGIWNWGSKVGNATAGWDVATALSAQSSFEMQRMSEFFSSLEWWRLEPCPERIGNQTDDWLKRIVFAATRERDLAVAYLPDHDRIQLNLTGFQEPIHSEWTHTVSGETVTQGEVVVAGEAQTLKAPNDGDWLLVLRCGSGGQAPVRQDAR